MSKLSKRQRSVQSKTRPPRRTPEGDALSWLSVQVLQLHGLLTHAGDVLAAPAGQSSARWLVLAAVENGPQSVAQVARILSLTRQSVQRTADLLTDEGLTVYEDNPAHQRAKLLKLTQEGHVRLRAIQAAQCVWADRLGAQLGEAELHRSSALLGRLMTLLSVDAGEHPDL